MSLKRHLRILGLAALASLAISAVAATAAQAFEWKIETTPGTTKTFAELGITNETVTPSAGKTFVLKSVVAKEAFEMTATTLTGEGAVITKGGTDSGKLIFSGLTVVKPAGCKTTEKITTKALKTELVEKGGVLYDKFFPAEGTTFANITITGCAAAETYPVKGVVFGKTEPLNTMKASQPVQFSQKINEEGSGEAIPLKLGAEKAELEGEGLNALSGTWAGKPFGAQ
jgi:hypothetical protein